MTPPLTETATSRFAVVDGLKIHYNEAGSGPVVICCEGQGPGTSAWVVYHRVFEALAQNFRCILVDQPGYGKSDALAVKGESRSTMYARFIRGLMKELAIPQATIIDMSFGAQTGQVLALESPDMVSSLVLHASGVGGPTLFGYNPMEGIAVMADTFANPTMDSMRRMMNSFLYEGEKYSDDQLMLRARLDAWLSRPDQEEARKNSDRVQRDVTANLPKLNKPVLQIHGRYDRVSPMEAGMRLFNYLPNSRFVILNHCGHWCPFEKPDDFARMTIDFVKNGR
jgi:2-hydroxy-6-oxonona-2,4-dienedioate hydrolase